MRYPGPTQYPAVNNYPDSDWPEVFVPSPSGAGTLCDVNDTDMGLVANEAVLASLPANEVVLVPVANEVVCE